MPACVVSKSAPPQVEEAGPLCRDPLRRRRGTPHCNRMRPALVQKELDPEQNPKTVLSSVGVARYNSIDFPHLHRGAAAALDNAHSPLGRRGGCLANSRSGKYES